MLPQKKNSSLQQPIGSNVMTILKAVDYLLWNPKNSLEEKIIATQRKSVNRESNGIKRYWPMAKSNIRKAESA
jgi:hypothetical protein